MKDHNAGWSCKGEQEKQARMVCLTASFRPELIGRHRGVLHFSKDCAKKTEEE